MTALTELIAPTTCHPITCAGCGAPIGGDEDAHTPHTPGCGIEDDGCSCPSVCADCCTTCQETSA